jgi:hypothetical protein
MKLFNAQTHSMLKGKTKKNQLKKTSGQLISTHQTCGLSLEIWTTYRKEREKKNEA